MRIRSIELQWTASFDASLPSASRLLIALGELLDDFDAEPVLIPLDDIPPEVPRLMLRNSTDSKRLTVSGRSISFAQKLPSLDIADVVGPEMVARALGLASIKFNGIGVVRRSLIEHEDAPSFLVSQFTSERAQRTSFSRTKDFQIHNLKQYIPDSWPHGEVNSWVRLSTGSVSDLDDEESMAGIIITQDINTGDRGDSQDFSTDDIRAFADLCHMEMNQIVELYFSDDSIEWVE